MVVVSHLFSFFDKIRETVPIPGHRLPDLELSFPDSPDSPVFLVMKFSPGGGPETPTKKIK